MPQWVEGGFDKKPFDLRDRDLLHVKRDDVRSLEVSGPEGAYALARTDAGEWAFTKPVATRAGRFRTGAFALPVGRIEANFSATAARTASPIFLSGTRPISSSKNPWASNWAPVRGSMPRAIR